MTRQEIIDSASFETFFNSLGGDISFVDEMVETYELSSRDVFNHIREGLAGGDAQLVQREAHSLKSGSASFGALAFAALCKELEDIGRSGVLDDAREKLGEIEAAYPSVLAALKARAASLRDGGQPAA